jgi:predicted amidohydrolase
MFDSGFSLNTEITADSQNVTAHFLLDLAREHQVLVHGARTVIPEQTPDTEIGDSGHPKAENRALIARPDGTSLEYAKIHPFSFGREHERFRGGREVTTFPWEVGEASLTICPAVCYDLRFPELFRRGLQQGAEMFVLGANWPSARQHHWRTLLIARAIENQAFVIGVNRCGSDPHLDYSGGSMALGPKGEILAELGDEERIESVEIDPEKLRSWRGEFPAWRDARLG